MKKTIYFSRILFGILLGMCSLSIHSQIVDNVLSGTTWRIVKDHNKVDSSGRIMCFFKDMHFEGLRADGSLFNLGKYSVVDPKSFITVHEGASLANLYHFSIAKDTLKFNGFYLSSGFSQTEPKIDAESIDEVWVKAPGNLADMDGGINFTADTLLADALTRAARERKMIFMDCYTSWCGPCKFLARYVFTKNIVDDFYNKNFINVSFDMETPEGRIIAAKYGIKAYPTLLFLNSKGELEHMSVGAMGALSLVQLGKAAQDSTTNMKMLRSKIVHGKYNVELLSTYLSQFPYAPEKNELLNGYFKHKSAKERLSAESWNLFNAYMDDVESPQFKFFMEHLAEYEKTVGKKAVQNKLEGLRYNPEKLRLLKKLYPATFEK